MGLCRIIPMPKRLKRALLTSTSAADVEERPQKDLMELKMTSPAHKPSQHSTEVPKIGSYGYLSNDEQAPLANKGRRKVSHSATQGGDNDRPLVRTRKRKVRTQQVTSDAVSTTELEVNHDEETLFR